MIDGQYIEARNILTNEVRVYKDVYAANEDLKAYADVKRRENFRSNDREFWMLKVIE